MKPIHPGSESHSTGDIVVTLEMVRAANNVDWIDRYRREFGVEDDDGLMASRLKELLVALKSAGLHLP